MLMYRSLYHKDGIILLKYALSQSKKSVKTRFWHKSCAKAETKETFFGYSVSNQYPNPYGS